MPRPRACKALWLRLDGSSAHETGLRPCEKWSFCSRFSEKVILHGRSSSAATLQPIIYAGHLATQVVINEYSFMQALRSRAGTANPLGPLR